MIAMSIVTLVEGCYVWRGVRRLCDIIFGHRHKKTSKMQQLMIVQLVMQGQREMKKLWMLLWTMIGRRVRGEALAM